MRHPPATTVSNDDRDAYLGCRPRCAIGFPCVEPLSRDQPPPASVCCPDSKCVAFVTDPNDPSQTVIEVYADSPDYEISLPVASIALPHRTANGIGALYLPSCFALARPLTFQQKSAFEFGNGRWHRHHQPAGRAPRVDRLTAHAEHYQTGATAIKVVHDTQRVRGTPGKPSPAMPSSSHEVAPAAKRLDDPRPQVRRERADGAHR
jgi:hypothetical protein